MNQHVVEVVVNTFLLRWKRLDLSKLSNGSKRGDYGNVCCKFSNGLNYSRLVEQLNITIAETLRGDLKSISLGLLGSGTALAIVDTWKNENYIGIEFKFPLDAWHKNSTIKDFLNTSIDATNGNIQTMDGMNGKIQINGLGGMNVTFLEELDAKKLAGLPARDLIGTQLSAAVVTCALVEDKIIVAQCSELEAPRPNNLLLEIKLEEVIFINPDAPLLHGFQGNFTIDVLAALLLHPPGT